ncbi:hypothetical protein [Nocardioides jensenii]|uniref:hypothetical protein n=1 Tax=Nocardioides jensenii TaxID=1843 RepID=UPI000A81EDCD|nr:hypothetical protein [Nocardioides jensenii]
MKVRDHTGQRWRVTRRWVPWRRKLKGALDLMPNFPVLGDDPISAVIGIVFLIIMIPFLILALIAGVELLLLLLLLPFAILARILFGRHWVVEARRGFTPWFETPAGRWSVSSGRVRDIAAAIERGDLPPRTIGSD